MKFKNKFCECFATFCYIGYLPGAPGTWGSLFAVILWFLLPMENYWYKAGLTLLIFLAGIWAAEVVENEAGEKDPSKVIIDEVVGMWLVLLAVPWLSYPENFLWILLAFLLFRFFDILKIPPMNKLEKIGGGLGIMLDDVMAGIYAGACLLFLIKIL